MVAGKCSTERAREMLGEAAFCIQPEAVRERLEQTAEMQEICALEATFPQSGYVDVLHFLGKVGVEGAYLDEPELLTLAQLADTASSIAAFFARNSDAPPPSAASSVTSSATAASATAAARKADRYPRLAEMAQALQTLAPVSRGIAGLVDRFGRVKDSASPELALLRRQLVEVQQQVGRRMQAILRKAQADGYADADAEVSIRDGRAVIPVSASAKRKVAGMVLDESATGKTSFIEPAEVVELNNRLRELGFAEKREVVKILIQFTAFLRPFLPPLTQAAELVARVDFIRAKALFANSIGGVKPALVDGQAIAWRSARHPLLEAALKKEGKAIVPLDLHLSPEKHILLISGPNAGGKSACIKTAGLLQYMLQCGFPIPVGVDSQAGIFDAIFIDIGDEQSLENDLSTYSSHLQSMKYFLRHASARTLALIDEFGTGTEPQLGGAIAEATLGALVESKAFAIVTTHYANLKYFAGNTPGVQNGAMLFDVQKIEPVFRLEYGAPGSSFAFEIARKIGLPDEVISKARALLGDKHADFDKSLRSIARDRRYWEEKRARVKLADKRLEELTLRYERELAQLRDERKRIIQEAKEAAKKLLGEANRTIENTIRSIKEAQADKEKTREARAQLQAFAQSVATPAAADDGDAAIARKMERLKEQQQRRRGEVKAQRGERDLAQDADRRNPSEGLLFVGGAARIVGQSVAGEIVKVNDNGSVVLAMGNIYTTVAADRLEPLSRNLARSMAKSSGAGSATLSVERLNFKPAIDVRGMRADEALREVEELIDRAMMFGVGEVRILHGKGTGALKEQIRRYLKSLPGVTAVADEHVQQGGAGVSVVKL
ncbi:MAG: Smr/MutS family protein [Prevotellaceae bacterium]|jgi:DNA mismatch repair protein MutS2|nr:Smr/MutS family protein [Prevotellaceae bacterium]